MSQDNNKDLSISGIAGFSNFDNFKILKFKLKEFKIYGHHGVNLNRQNRSQIYFRIPKYGSRLSGRCRRHFETTNSGFIV
jgi:hypothetical protein